MTDSIDEDTRRERIRAVIRDVVGNCPDRDDANLRDHGVDSFTLIELATALEEKFSIIIPDELLQWCTMATITAISGSVAQGHPIAEAGKL